MKDLITVNIHSFIDVITNSSSELFVCAEEKTLDAVKKILDAEEIQGIKDPFIFSREEYLKNKNNYDNDYSSIAGYFYDDLDPDIEEKTRKVHIRWEPYSGLAWRQDKGYWREEIRKAVGDERDKLVERIYNEILSGTTEKPWWWDNPIEADDCMGSALSTLEGKVIILSEGDNTIEWEDMDKLERIFNAYRYHLG